MSPSRQTVPRKRDIEAAVAAYNAIDRETAPLPPDATRLLAAMFPRNALWERNFEDLIAKGFDGGTLRRWLRTLTDAGFLSREEPARRGLVPIYRLHLPPVRR